MERIEALETAIQNNNLIGIYSVFYTIAHGDPCFSTGKFMDTLAYVKAKNISGLMQEFDGEEFKDSDSWDEEYWAYIASSLIDNFCEERILHLKEIGMKLYPNAKYHGTEQMNTQHIEKRTTSSQNNGYRIKTNHASNYGYSSRMSSDFNSSHQTGMSSDFNRGHQAGMSSDFNRGYQAGISSDFNHGHSNRIITEEQKRGVRFEHLNRNKKDDGGFLQRLFGRKTGR